MNCHLGGAIPHTGGSQKRASGAASAKYSYTKVIAEELPDAMQVADRFHLHQNLLEAIKKALNHELPATINIPHANKSTDLEQPCKKNRIQCG